MTSSFFSTFSILFQQSFHNSKDTTMPKAKLQTTKNQKHKALDEKIRRLLLCNPFVNVYEAKRHLDMLVHMTMPEKKEIIELLSEKYKKNLKEGKLTPASIKRHFCRWEELFGPVQLDDIGELLEDTHLSILEILPDRIKPQYIENWLSQYLFGQPEYARKIALAFYIHKLRVDETSLSLPRTNLLVHGPSGAGKTYGAQKMAAFFNIPFGVVNCNSLVQEGIEGNTLLNAFTKLYKRYGEETKHAAILLDEFDKLFENGTYNERILNELLNVIDDDNIVTFNKTDEKYNYEKVSLSTNKMLFIFTGVFKGLENIIVKRLGSKRIGFSQLDGSALAGDYHQYATEDDFAEFFNRAELAGRIQQYACVRELQAGDMAQLLLSSNESPFISFKNYFRTRNISLSITEDGAMAITTAACDKHLGVRGLKSLLFKVLSEDMFSLDNQKIIVDEDYVMKKIS